MKVQSNRIKKLIQTECSKQAGQQWVMRLETYLAARKVGVEKVLSIGKRLETYHHTSKVWKQAPVDLLLNLQKNNEVPYKTTNTRSRQMTLWFLALPLTNLWNLANSNSSSHRRDDKLHKNIPHWTSHVIHPTKIPFMWVPEGPHCWTKSYV